MSKATVADTQMVKLAGREPMSTEISAILAEFGCPVSQTTAALARAYWLTKYGTPTGCGACQRTSGGPVGAMWGADACSACARILAEHERKRVFAATPALPASPATATGNRTHWSVIRFALNETLRIARQQLGHEAESAALDELARKLDDNIREHGTTRCVDCDCDGHCTRIAAEPAETTAKRIALSETVNRLALASDGSAESVSALQDAVREYMGMLSLMPVATATGTAFDVNHNPRKCGAVVVLSEGGMSAPCNLPPNHIGGCHFPSPPEATATGTGTAGERCANCGGLRDAHTYVPEQQDDVCLSSPVDALTFYTPQATATGGRGAGGDSDRREAFANWLRRELPNNTVIGDIEWWIPRMLRAALGGASQGRAGVAAKLDALRAFSNGGASDDDHTDEALGGAS